MTRILLLADTHVPKRTRWLPDQVWAAVDAADLVIHAGDWVDLATLDALERRAARLVGVVGNNDGPELRARLPEVARTAVDGVRFAVVHETGAAAGRELRCEAAYPDADVLVFGHSHIPWDTTSPGGLRLLNPGSPTDRRRQPACTVMTLVVKGGSIRDVALVPVDRVTTPGGVTGRGRMTYAADRLPTSRPEHHEGSRVHRGDAEVRDDDGIAQAPSHRQRGDEFVDHLHPQECCDGVDHSGTTRGDDPPHEESDRRDQDREVDREEDVPSGSPLAEGRDCTRRVSQERDRDRDEHDDVEQ